MRSRIKNGTCEHCRQKQQVRKTEFGVLCVQCWAHEKIKRTPANEDKL